MRFSALIWAHDKNLQVFFPVEHVTAARNKKLSSLLNNNRKAKSNICGFGFGDSFFLRSRKYFLVFSIKSEEAFYFIALFSTS